MPADASRLQGKSILLVEDNFLLAFNYQQALEKAGALIVGPFADAGSARDHATAIDFAVLDVHLRAGTSLDYAMELYEKQIPLLFVTGFGDVPDMPGSLALAPRLTKPIAGAELVEAVAGLMEAPAF